MDYVFPLVNSLACDRSGFGVRELALALGGGPPQSKGFAAGANAGSSPGHSLASI